MHVAFDCGDQEFTRGGAGGCVGLFCLHKGKQVSDGALHDTRAFDHLGEEHVTITEEFTDDLHPIHERAFDHFERTIVFEPCFLRVAINVRDDTFDKRVGEAFFDSALAPVFF